MKSMRRQVTAAILAAMFFAVPGVAHDRNYRESGYRYGYEAGYGDGFDHAREDYHRGVGYGLKSHEYRKAEHGYQKWMGKKGDYKKGYRSGYERGYREGYQRRGYGRTRRNPERSYPYTGRYPYPE
jgi:hypothetical protein